MRTFRFYNCCSYPLMMDPLECLIYYQLQNKQEFLHYEQLVLYIVL
ncbi:unnamed protein product [Schistosoma margrebowiei]|uniref:Uncharacterized protein n=1 Tax=Schistosoma margrebowiei TaxID=48269 RepID=A0A183MT78_9TREM|nr:unnamed protein product [Schistosoma margrebowiei]